MNFKKIIFYQHDVLFGILEEIKENFNFNFDLIKVDKKDLEELKKNKTNDFLMISISEVNEIKKQLIINKTPIKIQKLIELINVKFLKENFDLQSDVVIGNYRLNLNSRQISKNNENMDLTEREINLILFLKKSSRPVNINELQKEGWEYGTELETHTVESHIYRLRKKVKEQFKDENFIKSLKEGYLIN